MTPSDADQDRARTWLLAEGCMPDDVQHLEQSLASLLAEVRAEALQSTDTLAYAEAIEKHSFARGKAEGAREEREAVVRYIRAAFPAFVSSREWSGVEMRPERDGGLVQKSYANAIERGDHRAGGRG